MRSSEIISKWWSVKPHGRQVTCDNEYEVFDRKTSKCELLSSVILVGPLYISSRWNSDINSRSQRDCGKVGCNRSELKSPMSNSFLLTLHRLFSHSEIKKSALDGGLYTQHIKKDLLLRRKMLSIETPT